MTALMALAGVIGYESAVPAAVTVQFDAGALTITAGSDDQVYLECSGGNVFINFSEVAPPIPCGLVTSIAVNGGSGSNNLDLSQATPVSMPSLIGVTINGGGGDDQMYGSQVANVLRGDDGHDYMVGHDGDDLLVGGAGDDTLDGAAGTNSVEGGAGSNVLSASNLTNAVLTATQLDHVGALTTFSAIARADLRGTDSGVLLDASAFPATTYLFGGSGNDTLLSAGGADGNFVSGGAGHDSIVGGALNDFLEGDAGDDTLEGGAGHDYLSGGDGDDVLSGGAGNDGLEPGSGTDTADGSTGTDYVVAYEQTMAVVTDPLLQTAGGTTTLVSIEGTVLEGTVAADRLDASAFTGYASLYGLEGNDTLLGAAGTAPGTAGNYIEGNEGHDSIVGGALGDHLRGDAGNDTLLGGTGNDFLFGGDGDDRLDGGTGNDTIDPGPGANAIDAGAGSDNLSLTDQTSLILTNTQFVQAASAPSTVTGVEQVQVTGTAANDLVDASGFSGSVTIQGLAGHDTLIGGTGVAGSSGNAISGGDGHDSIVGGTRADNLSGDAGNDTVRGGSGNDQLRGQDGDDSLFGEDGDDALQGGAGDDRLDGGSGRDGISESAAAADLTPTSYTVTAAALTGFGADTLAGVEDVTLTGNGGPNVIDAAAFVGRTVRLFGAGGHDDLRLPAQASVLSSTRSADGGAGNDTLTGGASGEAFTGGAGDDRIDGGAGVNTLTEQGPAGFTVTAQDLTTYVMVGHGVDTLARIQQLNLAGGTGDDVLDVAAFRGNTTLNGGPGNDLLRGTPLDDLFYIDAADTAIGGLGSDYAVVAPASQPTQIVLTNHAATFGGTTAPIDSIEGADVYADFNTATRIDASGFSGPTFLAGSIHADTMLGGPGDDILYGDDGNDVLDGGPGFDYVYAFIPGGVPVSATATTLVSHGTDTFTGAEGIVLFGSDGHDVVDGTSFPGYLYVDASGGNDTLIGGPGGVEFYGGDGDDSLVGGAGADFLSGGPGNNTIIGGPGDDRILATASERNTIDGGAGDDVLVFQREGLTATETAAGLVVGGVQVVTFMGKPELVSFDGAFAATVYRAAEGATGPFFDLDLAIANPNAEAVPIVLTFLTPDGTRIERLQTLAPLSRSTVAVDAVPGLEETAVSSVVVSPGGKRLLVERTSRWDATGYGGHGARSTEGASNTWYFAEGSQGFFDTYLLLGNRNGQPTPVTVRFVLESGTVVTRAYSIEAWGRLTVWTGGIPELVGQSFSIDVRSDNGFGIFAERAMYFGAPRFWEGGHATLGARTPSRSWYHAEGATGAYFDTYVLVYNPQPVPTVVTFTYLLESGQRISRTRTVNPFTRVTVNLENEDALLANTAVATIVTADLPIVSERSMYWPGPAATWQEGNNELGATATGVAWGVAEGRVGGPAQHDTYLLVANPGDAAATIEVTFLRASGEPVIKNYVVGAGSRFNIHVASMVPELSNESFGAIVASTNGVPILVERSMYWNAGGVTWAAGATVVALRLL